MDGIFVVRERGGLDEASHSLRAAVWTPSGTTTTAVAEQPPVYLRSSAKPFQATACVLTGAADRFGLARRHLAVACASHSGQPGHVRAAGEILAAAGLTPAALDCGPHPPVFTASAAALIAADDAPTPLHNNCSGKHAGMLAACVAAGWPTEGYVDPDHPLQQMIRTNVAAGSRVAAPTIRIGMDGCSAPVFGMPLAGAARLFATLAAPQEAGAPDDLAAALDRLTDAMAAAPWMVGGTGRADTDLLRASRRRILSKVGAEGLWCIGLRGRAVGVAVKCADGNSAAAYRAGFAMLRAGGHLDDRAWAALTPHHDSLRRNHARREIGRVRVELPDAIVEALRD